MADMQAVLDQIDDLVDVVDDAYKKSQKANNTSKFLYGKLNGLSVARGIVLQHMNTPEDQECQEHPVISWEQSCGVK